MGRVMAKEVDRIKKIPSVIQKIATTISALLAILGVLTTGGQWIINEVSAATNQRIDTLEQTIAQNDHETRLSVVRLELMTLISHDPTNVVEIEKLARLYFNELGGNSYMTSIVSKWCKEYDSDCGLIILK